MALINILVLLALFTLCSNQIEHDTNIDLLHRKYIYAIDLTNIALKDAIPEGITYFSELDKLSPEQADIISEKWNNYERSKNLIKDPYNERDIDSVINFNEQTLSQSLRNMHDLNKAKSDYESHIAGIKHNQIIEYILIIPIWLIFVLIFYTFGKIVGKIKSHINS